MLIPGPASKRRNAGGVAPTIDDCSWPDRIHVSAPKRIFKLVAVGTGPVPLPASCIVNAVVSKISNTVTICRAVDLEAPTPPDGPVLPVVTRPPNVIGCRRLIEPIAIWTRDQIRVRITVLARRPRVTAEFMLFHLDLSRSGVGFLVFHDRRIQIAPID